MQTDTTQGRESPWSDGTPGRALRLYSTVLSYAIVELASRKSAAGMRSARSSSRSHHTGIEHLKSMLQPGTTRRKYNSHILGSGATNLARVNQDTCLYATLK